MYVCVCNAVTESQIHEAVENGVSTVKQLKEELGVGADCASCGSCAKACIKSAKQSKSGNKMMAALADKTMIAISPISLGAR